jgi:hypothetical protein
LDLSKALKFDPLKIRTRTFEFAGQLFRIKVPTVTETDALVASWENFDENELRRQFENLSNPIKETLALASEEEKAKVIITEEDMVVEGKSLLETAKNALRIKNQVLSLFKLLIPVNPEDNFDTLTYEEIEEWLPLPIQLSLLDEMKKAISFEYNYAQVKKN